MKKNAAFRISADICFYFSLLSIFPALSPWRLQMALFAAACLVVSLIAVHCRSALVRLLLSLLPALCFWGSPLRPLLFFPALAWLYVILVLTMGNFFMWLDEYRRIYRAMLIVCLCALAANVAHSAIFHGDVISYPSLIYAFLFLCLGVIAMRGMQMNEDMDKSWRLTNALTVIGAPALAVGCSLLLYLLLSRLKPVVQFLFRPIGLFFLWLFNTLFPGEYEAPLPTPTPDPLVLPTPAFVEEATGHGNYVMDDMADKFKMSSLLMEKATMIGAYVVLAALLLLAIFLLVRHARRNRPDSENERTVYEKTANGDAPKKRRKNRAGFLGGPADQVRAVYKQYMGLMLDKGVRIRQDSTSLDILDEADRISLSPEAERLRELYLKARYAENGSVTREDVQEARHCLKAIEADENWKK